MTDDNHSLLQNVAAISCDFHTHKRYHEFYETFGEDLHGFTGMYELCIDMAKALTAWEQSTGRETDAYDRGPLNWIEVVENYVDHMIVESLKNEYRETATDCLREFLNGAGMS